VGGLRGIATPVAVVELESTAAMGGLETRGERLEMESRTSGDGGVMVEEKRDEEKQERVDFRR
jgi:hypothetical protein